MRIDVRIWFGPGIINKIIIIINTDYIFSARRRRQKAKYLYLILLFD